MHTCDRVSRLARFTSAMSAGLLILAVASPANAQPPQGPYKSQKAIVCDTADQIRAIVVAGRENGQSGAFSQFLLLTKQLDAAKEPACTIIDVDAAAVEAIELGTFRIFADTPRHAWAVHICNGGVNGWMLYTEAGPQSGGRALALEEESNPMPERAT